MEKGTKENPKECIRLDAAEGLLDELKKQRSDIGKIVTIANWSARREWKGCRCGCSRKKWEVGIPQKQS